MAGNVFIIEDTLKDPHFADNPYVTGHPFIRFYAGMALRDHKTKMPVGVFCIKDAKPKDSTTKEIAQFITFAHKAESELNIKLHS